MAAYYKISYGTGFYWLQSYVVKVDYPTTDYGSLVDMLIDYLIENDKSNILDMDNEYEWDENGENIRRRDDPSWIIYPDTFVTGGNCGDVLMHHGELRIDEIKEDEIGELKVVSE